MLFNGVYFRLSLPDLDLFWTWSDNSLGPKQQCEQFLKHLSNLKAFYPNPNLNQPSRIMSNFESSVSSILSLSLNECYSFFCKYVWLIKIFQVHMYKVWIKLNINNGRLSQWQVI